MTLLKPFRQKRTVPVSDVIKGWPATRKGTRTSQVARVSMLVAHPHPHP